MVNEDYYFWCCDWCDSENLVLWAKRQNGTNCGACHRRKQISSLPPFIPSTFAISVPRTQPVTTAEPEIMPHS